jgi:citronellol/citronellal dehydrogenase
MPADGAPQRRQTNAEPAMGQRQACRPNLDNAYRSVFRGDLFANQVVVVTGDGSGISRCTAHELACLGATIVIIGRKPEKLARVAPEITEDGGEVGDYTCDIRDETMVKTTVVAILSKYGRIDGLVNNTGGQFSAPLASISQKGWATVARNSLTCGFLMARECYTQCLQRSGGSIVNIVADMWLGMSGMGHSGAARAGMVNLTTTAALEWASSGVRVNAVAPGFIASAGLDSYPESRRTCRCSAWALRRRCPLPLFSCFPLQPPSSPASHFRLMTPLQPHGVMRSCQSTVDQPFGTVSTVTAPCVRRQAKRTC